MQEGNHMKYFRCSALLKFTYDAMVHVQCVYTVHMQLQLKYKQDAWKHKQFPNIDDDRVGCTRALLFQSISDILFVLMPISEAIK